MSQALISTMVRLACEMADAYGATLFLVDGDVLRPFVVYNLPKEYILGIGTVRVGTQCCGRAVASQRPWIVIDMLADPLFADGREGAMASPIRAAFSVPVLDGMKVIGSLACHYTAPHSPSRLDIERNEVFAKLIGISMRSVVLTPFPNPLFNGPTEHVELSA